MASKSHDPSSSELLTDFDIADVVNWEDPTYGSKTINYDELLDTHGGTHHPVERHRPRSGVHASEAAGVPLQQGGGVLPKQTIASHSTSQHMSIFERHSMKSEMHAPSFPDLDNVDLPPITPPCVSPDVEKRPLHSSVFSTPSCDDVERDHVSFSGLEALQKISSEPIDDQEPSGLEALRAEVDNVSSFKSKVEQVAKSSTHSTKPVSSSFLSAFANKSDTTTKPLQATIPQSFAVRSNTLSQQAGNVADAGQNASLGMPINKGNQQAATPEAPLAGNTMVLQLPGIAGKPPGKPLKGQLVKTADQKLMFVTEIDGKKVGYLIRQPTVPIATPSPGTPSSSVNPMKPVDADTVQSPTQTPWNVAAPAPSLSSQNDMTSSNRKTKQDSSDDDMTPLSRVAESLKSTSLSPKSKKSRKRKEKGKKKKDSRKPTKPVTAYQFFFKDIQSSIRQQNPSASFGEVSKIVSQMWENLSFDNKKGYQEKGEEAKQEYVLKLGEYRAVLAQENHGLPPAVNDGLDSAPVGSPLNNYPSPELKFIDDRTDVHKTREVAYIPNTGQHQETPLFSLQPPVASSQATSTQPNTNTTVLTKKKLLADEKAKRKQQAGGTNVRRADKPSWDASSDNALPRLSSPVQQTALDSPNQPPSLKFKIPKKNETSGGSLSENGIAKTSPAAKVCIRDDCTNPSKHSRERGSLYCSNNCLLLHCKNVFSLWVNERQEDSS